MVDFICWLIGLFLINWMESKPELLEFINWLLHQINPSIQTIKFIEIQSGFELKFI